MKTLTILAALSATTAAFAAQSEKPNIVLIYADDMGWGDMSCQNPNSKINTPNIDKLASQGVRFTDGHSSAATSTPSRYGLLSGNYHWRRTNSMVNGYGSSPFHDGELTLPKMLSESGYFTALIGKWHLGWDWNSVITPSGRKKQVGVADPAKVKYKASDFDWSNDFEGGPTERGFDYYFGDGTINFPPYCWIENDRVDDPPTTMIRNVYPFDNNYKPLEGTVILRQGPAMKDWDPNKVQPTLVKRMERVISQQSDDKPFFLMCSLPSPHAPIVPSPEFRGKSKAGYFGDYVVEVDNIVGRIIAALDKKGMSENTIIIFTADNGAEKFAYERLERFDHNSTEGLRGVKRDTYEGGHRVPFIVRWDGVVDAGRVSAEPISQVDLFATFASMCGYDIPNEFAVDSYNMMPVIKGEKYKSPIREAMVYSANDERFAIRSGDWVLVDSYSGSHNDVPEYYLNRYGYKEYKKGEKFELLYNVKDDQQQIHDLSKKNPKKVAELRTLLNKIKKDGRSVTH